MDSIAYTPVREQLLSTAPATFPDSSVHPQTMMEFSRSIGNDPYRLISPRHLFSSSPYLSGTSLRREPRRRFNNLHSEDGPSSLPTTRIPSDIPLPNYVFPSPRSSCLFEASFLIHHFWTFALYGFWHSFTQVLLGTGLYKTHVLLL
ncbi:hypothetical protein PNOK_0501300 [Pyrrhoderma noxium]|uniref:Uncharacterized protein n=1 Tax=Pyrrhoderma noxium TaxID=2282107 RepID=A0A286UKM4_9AGAM|nr:hypothetical protein PNOK_0501300 [Pyrrhoderma noxium]